LGSKVVVAGEVKSPGTWVTCTGTVRGWYFGSVNYTEKLSALSGTEIEQGVLQLDPSELVASAPGGTESTGIETVFGAGLRASIDREEQPARPRPATAITMTLRMVHPSFFVRRSATVPRGGTIRGSGDRRNCR
jgi:hypothetical protein